MKIKSLKSSTIIVLFIFFCITKAISAQDKLKIPEDSKPSNCEDILYQLDKAIYANSKNEKQKLILIFRLGKGESNEKLNETRIDRIRKYLERKGYSPRTVFAESSKRNDLGTMEIYLQGELFTELFFNRQNRLGICVE
jgi:hypothetical protein